MAVSTTIGWGVGMGALLAVAACQPLDQLPAPPAQAVHHAPASVPAPLVRG